MPSWNLESKKHGISVFCLQNTVSLAEPSKTSQGLFKLKERALIGVTLGGNFPVFSGFLSASAIRNDVPDQQDIIARSSNSLCKTSVFKISLLPP